MTAGRAIAHSEESPAGRPTVLHGLQLWIALPEQDRFIEPRFAHHADLPVVREGSTQVTVVIGEHRGERSPAEVFTPLTGLEVAVPGGVRRQGRPGTRVDVRARHRASPLRFQAISLNLPVVTVP